MSHGIHLGYQLTGGVRADAYRVPTKADLAIH
jgi:hypothetical protein